MNLLSVLLFVQKFNVNHDNMNTYASILLWVVPGFMVLMTVEALYGHFTNKQTYSFMDTLSSLSSGITNVLKDSLGLVLVILSYPYILDTIAVFDLESSVMLYVVAFICIDFASYWNHRLNLEFSKCMLIKFWYHTQHIGKLGFLEYIIVTPSQHRVHHAINPIYIDKNLSAIFCIWDRAFGTFQEELDEEPPVYGVLKPVNTWNPLLINFQHAFNVIQDAYNTSSFKDKLRIWFMPTGWRPNDVVEKFPRNIITDHNNREKYSPNYSNFMKFTAIFHFISINFLLYFFLSNISIIETDLRLIFGLIIFISVFGFTSLLDLQSWAPFFEVLRSVSTILILYSINDYSLFVNYPTEFSLIIAYFVLSSLISFIIIFNKNHYLIKFSNATS